MKGTREMKGKSTVTVSDTPTKGESARDRDHTNDPKVNAISMKVVKMMWIEAEKFSNKMQKKKNKASINLKVQAKKKISMTSSFKKIRSQFIDHYLPDAYAIDISSDDDISDKELVDIDTASP